VLGLAGLVSTSSAFCTCGPGIAVPRIGHLEPNLVCEKRYLMRDF
jgi:hypothetical protein